MAQILVLDDDEVSGRLITHMLRKSGHEVLTDLNPADAWQHMSESPVDLLILDTELGEEQGWDVLARIRKDVVFRDLPVIVHSTNSRRDVVERYIDLGVQGILVKPCRADRLGQDVERIMQDPWCNRLFEPEETVRSRTGLSSSGVRGLYRDAFEQLAGATEIVENLKEAPDNSSSLARLAAVRSCAVNIGFDLMVRFVDAVRSAVNNNDKERIAVLVDRMTVLIRLLENRMGEDENASDEEGDESAEGNGAEAGDESGESVEGEPEAPPSETTEAAA